MFLVHCATGIGLTLFALTIPMPFHPVDIAGVMWSLVPYVFIGVMVITFLVTRGVAFLLASIYGFLASGANEYLFHQGFPTFDPDRPVGSCLTSKGMPSGHCVNVIGYWILAMGEAFTQPSARFNWKKKLIFVVVASAIFLPVPWARTQVQDHSEAQVVIGSVLGLACGYVYFLILFFVVRRYVDWFTNLRFCAWIGMRNNYWPNEFSHRKIDREQPELSIIEEVPLEELELPQQGMAQEYSENQYNDIGFEPELKTPFKEDSQEIEVIISKQVAK